MSHNPKPKPCLCCRRKSWDGGTCGKCLTRLLGTSDEAQAAFDTALVCEDNRRWYAFRVTGGGEERLRKLMLLGVYQREKEADAAALQSIGDPGCAHRDYLWE